MDAQSLPQPNEPFELWRPRLVAALTALSMADLQDYAGTVFPGSPFDGQLYYRTDARWLYHWDAARSKWLGEVIPVIVSYRGSWAGGAYGFHQASMQGSASVGHPVAYPATLVSWAHRLGTSASGNFEVRVNGSIVQTIAHGTTSYENNALSVDLAKGDVLSVSNASGTVANAQIQMLLSRRGT